MIKRGGNLKKLTTAFSKLINNHQFQFEKSNKAKESLIHDITQQTSLTGRPTTLEQKKSLQPQFAPVRPWFGPQIIFEVSALLDVRHCPKLQSCAISRKANDAYLKNGKNPYFEPNFGCPNFFFFFFCKFYLYQLHIVRSYHPIQFTGKLMNQNGEFWPKLGPPKFFHEFYLY